MLGALAGSEKARVLLWGMAGIGKTAMACHIANLQLDPAAPQAWECVLWTTWGSSCRGGLLCVGFTPCRHRNASVVWQCMISKFGVCAGEVPVLRALQKLLYQLELRAYGAKIMLEDARVILQQWLHGRHMLVVMDDVWDRRIPGLLQTADCQLLVTAQQRSTGLSGWQVVNLTPQLFHDSGVASHLVDPKGARFTGRLLVSNIPDTLWCHICAFGRTLICSMMRSGSDKACHLHRTRMPLLRSACTILVSCWQLQEVWTLQVAALGLPCATALNRIRSTLFNSRNAAAAYWGCMPKNYWQP